MNRSHPDPLTQQLLDHTYRMDQTAFPLKQRRPPASRADRAPTPAVVLVDRAWAGDLDYLQGHLDDHGIPVMRFDPETVHQHEVLLDPSNRRLHVDDALPDLGVRTVVIRPQGNPRNDGRSNIGRRSDAP